MLKISSAAANSRLLTRALISSALNILAEDRDSSEALGPRESVSWSQDRRYPDGGIKYREIATNVTPPVQSTAFHAGFIIPKVFISPKEIPFIIIYLSKKLTFIAS